MYKNEMNTKEMIKKHYCGLNMLLLDKSATKSIPYSRTNVPFLLIISQWKHICKNVLITQVKRNVSERVWSCNNALIHTAEKIQYCAPCAPMRL